VAFVAFIALVALVALVAFIALVALVAFIAMADALVALVAFIAMGADLVALVALKATGLVALVAFIAMGADLVAFVAFKAELVGTETAGLLPKLSTRISGRSRPVASLILAFCSGVRWILTSFAISVPPCLLLPSRNNEAKSLRQPANVKTVI